ncbi:ribonuclease H-like domain-containing protein, partial [Tanacetum coccineum]
ARQLLERAHMVNCNPSRTIDTDFKLGSDDIPVQDPTLYRSLAGGLQYLTFPRLHFSLGTLMLIGQVALPPAATLVYCDNVSAVYMSANPVQYQRTKHIEIDIHFVRDMVKAGHVRVLHVPSRFPYADIFTKGLPSALFEDFCSSLRVRPPPAPTTGAY